MVAVSPSCSFAPAQPNWIGLLDHPYAPSTSPRPSPICPHGWHRLLRLNRSVSPKLATPRPRSYPSRRASATLHTLSDSGPARWSCLTSSTPCAKRRFGGFSRGFMRRPLDMRRWAADRPGRLPSAARQMLADGERDLCSSVASRRAIIKNGCGRPDLQTDAHLSSHSLPNRGFTALPVSAAHVRAVGSLPARHHDPFDRPQVKQARVEGIALVRSDALLGS